MRKETRKEELIRELKESRIDTVKELNALRLLGLKNYQNELDVLLDRLAFIDKQIEILEEE